MLIDQPNRKQRFDAAGGDNQALVAVMREHGRGVRQILGALVESWEAVEQLEVVVWQTMRKDLGANDVLMLARATAHAAALHHLEQADREAIQGRDVLRRLVVQSALADLRGPPPLVPVDEQVRQRLQQLSEDQRTLLDLYYAHGIALRHLALQRQVPPADLAHDCCAARSACDWRPAVQTPAGDRLLPSLTEDLLSGTLDPDSRGLLATSVTQDLGRGVRLERQVRLHVVLRGLLGPFTDHEAQTIVAAVTGQSDPLRPQAASATGSGRTRVRQSDVVRSPTSSRRPVSHAGGKRHPPWVIPVGIGSVLLVLAVLMLPGRATAQPRTPLANNETAPRMESAPTKIPAPAQEPAPPVPTPGASALRPQQVLASAPEKPTEAPKPPPSAPPEPTPAAPLPLETVTLINADTDKPIRGYESLPQDVTIRLSQLPTRRINFEFGAPAEIKSLTFSFPGCSLRKDGVEKGRPFSLSNTGPDFKSWTPVPGNYTLTLSACSDGEGKKVVRRTSWRIRFSE